jgi:ABC-type nickel/cobalt efflux system permease component RcnA
MLSTDTLHVFYFPAAVALGALHALEPGHAKALTASYLIGIKGTKRDSAILGLSVALTLLRLSRELILDSLSVFRLLLMLPGRHRLFVFALLSFLLQTE